jgi:hypothetical protein
MRALSPFPLDILEIELRVSDVTVPTAGILLQAP